MATEQEKETALQFALIDFAEALKLHGVDKVMASMDEQTFWHLYKWFDEMYPARRS